MKSPSRGWQYGRTPGVLAAIAALVATTIAALVVAAEPTTATDAPQSPLVARGRVGLNLAGAELLIARAQANATEMKLRLNIAVVDDGGHLLAFARMDGARPASVATAITKATTAATMRQATGPVRKGDEAPDALLNLSLQNAAAASGGKITTLFGGVPVTIDGQVIGAIGIGGGSGEQDAEVARAAVDALNDAIAKP